MMTDLISHDVPDIEGFFKIYHERVYRYVLSLMHNSMEAEDLTMEVFLRAYRQQDTLREQGALLAWLYRIATNICFDRLRQHTRRSPLESEADLDELDLYDPEAPSLQKIVEKNEMSACIEQYLVDLPDSYRAVILLHDMHGLTGPEIAETLGISLATAKIRLHRARGKLRAALEAGCRFSHDEDGSLACESNPD